LPRAVFGHAKADDNRAWLAKRSSQLAMSETARRAHSTIREIVQSNRTSAPIP
jgi:hypothetical protein